MSANSYSSPNLHPLVGRPVETESAEDAVRKLMGVSQRGATASPIEPRTSEIPARLAAIEPEPAGVDGSADTSGRTFGTGWRHTRAAILSYRPTPRHMAILLLAVIAVTMPWLIPGLGITALILVLVSYFTVGPDRFSEFVARWHGWFSRRNPEQGEALRKNAEWLSTRLTGVVERLPDRWTTGLYLPDFSRDDEGAELPTNDPFDRLANESSA